jgi:hypothetical protein
MHKILYKTFPAAAALEALFAVPSIFLHPAIIIE